MRDSGGGGPARRVDVGASRGNAPIFVGEGLGGSHSREVDDAVKGSRRPPATSRKDRGTPIAVAMAAAMVLACGPLSAEGLPRAPRAARGISRRRPFSRGCWQEEEDRLLLRRVRLRGGGGGPDIVPPTPPDPPPLSPPFSKQFGGMPSVVTWISPCTPFGGPIGAGGGILPGEQQHPSQHQHQNQQQQYSSRHYTEQQAGRGCSGNEIDEASADRPPRKPERNEPLRRPPPADSIPGAGGTRISISSSSSSSSSGGELHKGGFFITRTASPTRVVRGSDKEASGSGGGGGVPGVMMHDGVMAGGIGDSMRQQCQTMPGDGCKPFKMSTILTSFTGLSVRPAVTMTAAKDTAGGSDFGEQATGAAVAAVAKHRIVLAHLMRDAGPRAFPVLMFLTALPNCIPGPPLLNFIFGIPLIFITIQFALGMRQPWLPRLIAEMNLPSSFVTTVVRAVLPIVTRIEARTKPRLTLLQSSPIFHRLLGFFLVTLACTLTMPVPFTTQPASISLAIVTLGMAEGDGACVGVGVGMGISSQILLYYLLKFAWFAGKKVADKLKAKADV